MRLAHVRVMPGTFISSSMPAWLISTRASGGGIVCCAGAAVCGIVAGVANSAVTTSTAKMIRICTVPFCSWLPFCRKAMQPRSKPAGRIQCWPATPLGCNNKCMANSPATPTPDGSLGVRIFGKVRVTLLVALLVLLALCIVFSWTTRGAMSTLPCLNGKGRGSMLGAPQTLVNLQPWQTAQALAPMAVSAEEKEYAGEAERLADHEVDQAFAAALRQASLAAQHRTLTGEALALSRKIAQLQQLEQQDQVVVTALQAKTAASSGHAKSAADSGSNSGFGSNDLDVAKAQLGLDADELADAQEDLQRASGDNSARIQDELTAHEAAMREYDSRAQGEGQIAVLSVAQNGTLGRRT